MAVMRTGGIGFVAAKRVGRGAPQLGDDLESEKYSGEMLAAAVFEARESYAANANNPEQARCPWPCLSSAGIRRDLPA